MDRDPSFLSRTFRSLRHRSYALYFCGQLVSFTGSWMQSAALMWLVYALTDDPFWPPVMLVAAVGPTLFLGPIGGALADKHSKKKLIFLTQFLFLSTASILALLVAVNVVNPWLLLVIQCVNGLVQSVDLPARLAFVPDLVPREDLINAVGLNSLTFNLARAFGPALAGGLFIAAGYAIRMEYWHDSAARLGAMFCFTMNAVSYIAVLIALAKIHVECHIERSKQRGHFWDGVRYLRTRPGLAWLVILTGVLSIFAWPVLTLLPAYTKQVLEREERTYSFLVSALGAGALIGSLITAGFGTPARRERCLVLGTVASLIGMLGLILTHQVEFAVPSCMIFGFGLILYLSTGQSTMQLDSPDRTRGKVMALWAMTLSGSSIPGHLIAGHAARVFPVDNVLIALFIGVAVSVCGIFSLAVSKTLRPHRES